MDNASKALIMAGGILIALKNNEKIKLFPKRNYEFRSFFEDEN